MQDADRHKNIAKSCSASPACSLGGEGAQLGGNLLLVARSALLRTSELEGQTKVHSFILPETGPVSFLFPLFLTLVTTHSRSVVFYFTH